MPTIQQLIQFLIANNNVGSNSAITAYNLASHFGISDGGQEVPMRNVIRDAISAGELIGSSNQGFYIINTIQELDENLDSLTSRAEGILNRRRNMMNSWNNLNNANQTLKTDLFVKP